MGEVDNAQIIVSIFNELDEISQRKEKLTYPATGF